MKTYALSRFSSHRMNPNRTPCTSTNAHGDGTIPARSGEGGELGKKKEKTVVRAFLRVFASLTGVKRKS